MEFFSSDRFVNPEKGDLLISEPYLPDPNFERTVIFLCKNDENGTFGFVLNKKAHVELHEIIDDVDVHPQSLFIGGPIEQNTLHFLHREHIFVDSSTRIIDGVCWASDFKNLSEMRNIFSPQPKDIRFFMGYSGWVPGQLINEVKARSWIVFKNTSAEMIFDWNSQNLWKQCLEIMGGKYRIMSNYPKDFRQN